ncbi:PD-(D/E)XK nuclease family protein [Flectobacillus major]|uniref:PD-(D/E)XK nuclease family protein n=1 Tax=Flectobacillus major TaxID=103 RepID=UPI0004073E80|nr:PD-(D/E)XK nuclease family protein [Flectobacillus major]
METFLEKAAEHIFRKHTTQQLSGICIVIPSRRGVLYFKQALANQANAPFLAPDVLAIDDFVMFTTGLKQIDPVSLLFELYDVFKEIDPQVVFERFMTWAPTLLNDFDKIDQYLVDPKKLFGFMTEAKALERWKMQLGESQRDKLKSTDRTDKYFKLFENIYEVYQKLQIRLREKGLVYRGMAYRELAEHIPAYMLDNPLHKKYYFVGFNALSNAEEKIIRTLLKRKDGDDFFAETLWDSDTYYLLNKDQKAGNWLRSYKSGDGLPDNLPLFNNEWNWSEDALLKGHKNIQIIGVANASMQAKIAGELYTQWSQKDKTAHQKPTPTAIVLGDENLLVPVMNSLGSDITNLNITMGLSLKSSMLFTLIDAMFEMQRNLVEFKNAEGEAIRIPKFSYRQVVRVLNHPFIRRYETLNYPEQAPPQEQDITEEVINPIRQTLREITSLNKVFLSSKELLEMGKGDKLFNIIFRYWNQKPKEAVKQFYELIDVLREVYRERQDAVETEYLYQFYLILQRMEMILAERGDSVTIKSFKTFLFELIKQTKIPFESETDQTLQIMGMLETRTLDFERLIILSVNEGILPQGKRQNTLIPYEALSDPQFNLPTHNHADAVMAYHFFRLLQRAKEVVLVHVLPSDTYGAGEKSRFILQLEHELKHLNKNLTITENNIQFEVNIPTEQQETGLSITKTDDIVTLLQNDIAERGIYPSHLNQYIDCSMKYYFNRVAGIAQEEEVAEKLASDSFGNWIHKTLENIDKEFTEKGGIIQKQEMERVYQNLNSYLKTAFEQTNPGLRMTEGMNYILYQVGETIVRKFLKFQLENEPYPVELLDAEKTLKVALSVEVEGKAIPLKIAGRIDRIDRIHGKTIRVIDYKTGMVKAEELTIKSEDLDEKLLLDSKNGKLRQLWLYKYMVLKRMLSERGLTIRGKKLLPHDNKVVSGIYSFRNVEEGLLEQDLHFAEDESLEQFLVASEHQIARFVKMLLDPNQPFVRTEDREICKLCDFVRICGR